MGSTTATPPQSSFFEKAEAVPPDAIFEVTKRYNADKFPQKVNLGQGTYRDGNGNPWILPSVRMAEEKLGNPGHEYLPIAGYKPFRDNAVKVVFEGTNLLKEERLSTCQAISGTGALLLAAMTLKQSQSGIQNIYITSPTWSNHDLLFSRQGFSVHSLPYYSPETRSYDHHSFLSSITSSIPANSAIVLHACAHNPTGCDPSRQQWLELASVLKEKGIFPIFDAAYLGFNSGSVEQDRWSVLHFAEELQMECAVAMSFAKSMGLYGERVGLTVFSCKDKKTAETVGSVMENCQRATVSNPPAYGARIAAEVLGGEGEARKQWGRDLVEMSGRIRGMRVRLVEELGKLETPGDWGHLVVQTGMFGYTGIMRGMVRWLEDKHHVYMADTSRISIAGLNEGNIEYFARALDDAVRNGDGYGDGQ